MKITIEIRKTVFTYAWELFRNGAATFGEALRQAWKTVKTTIAVLTNKKAIITNFADAMKKVIYAFFVKSELEKATTEGTNFAFAYIAGVGTANERVRTASGCAITKANYEFVGSGNNAKPSHVVSYFDEERNAPRMFRIENLIVPN